jgi:hypothetical protein
LGRAIRNPHPKQQQEGDDEAREMRGKKKLTEII